MIITKAGAKGGVAKTIGSIYLATILTNLGFTVRVLDGDPQGSATRWSLQARRNKAPLPFEVKTTNKAELEFEIDDPTLTDDVDVVIIDTAPGDPGVMDAAIELSDLTVVCTKPSIDDVHQAKAVVENSGDNICSILITQVDKRTKGWSVLQDDLADRNLPIFGTIISQKVDYTEVFGTLPTNLDNYTELWDEICEDFPQLIPVKD